MKCKSFKLIKYDKDQQTQLNTIASISSRINNALKKKADDFLGLVQP